MIKEHIQPVGLNICAHHKGGTSATIYWLMTGIE